jgi:hypothetical protein
MSRVIRRFRSALGVPGYLWCSWMLAWATMRPHENGLRQMVALLRARQQVN